MLLKLKSTHLLLTAALGTVALLGFCEVVLRLAAAGRQRRDPNRARVQDIMTRRMGQIWMAERRQNPLFPPFPVFANKGFDDEDRMRLVFDNARLPPNVSWVGGDFLWSPLRRRAALFTVRTNSLGFRDPPRQARKSKGTYRIICLGDYQTFGHGVSDEQTFERRLETLLHEGGDGRFEVWNGGKQAATAIMGLARLRYEIMDYQPDLLILQYGMTDKNVGEDGRLLHKWVHIALMRSYVVRVASVFNRRWQQPQINRRWAEAMRRMVFWAKRRGVPVILLDCPFQKPEFLQRLAASSPNIRFVRVHDAFRRYPPSKKQWETFLGGENWTEEFLPGERARRNWPAAPYHVDLYNIGALGHEVVARALVAPARELLKRAKSVGISGAAASARGRRPPRSPSAVSVR